ncbi:Bug family tripartite tricarboxylate transporter substrate binding protein [Zwartia sp.]|uniref:Bug family tripartite tricarboxylate transporter substrate binding protein n=1 Tax=Zwartia sp. TaxID=2978004 RepID=UPI003BB169A0
MSHFRKITMKAALGTFAAGLVLCSLSINESHAQELKPLADFPKQTITIVSPFPPGGGNDKISRLLAAELAPIVGQPVVVENRGGAGGNLGTSSVARAKPDGYTILTSQTSIIGVNPALYVNAGFKPKQDFEPLSQLTSAPVVFVVRADSPYKTMNDYIADARAKPDTLTFATPGNGTLSHLTTSRMATQEKLQLTHIPYKGAGPAVTDLMGGQVAMVVTSPSSVEGLVASGKLRVIASTNSDLLGVFKGVPTLADQGIKDMNVTDWYGVFVPKATPADRVSYLETAIRKAMASAEMKMKVNQSGSQVIASPRADFIKTVDKEIADWGAVVKAAGLKVD